MTKSLDVELKFELETIVKTARKIGVPYRQLLEAVNAGIIPYYRLGNSHRLVRPSEVIALMRNEGGFHE